MITTSWSQKQSHSCCKKQTYWIWQYEVWSCQSNLSSRGQWDTSERLKCQKLGKKRKKKRSEVGLSAGRKTPKTTTCYSHSLQTNMTATIIPPFFECTDESYKVNGGYPCGVGLLTFSFFGESASISLAAFLPASLTLSFLGQSLQPWLPQYHFFDIKCHWAPVNRFTLVLYVLRCRLICWQVCASFFFFVFFLLWRTQT